MIKTNYDVFNDDFFKNYLNFLISKVFKILPISENEPDTLKNYLESLILELSGSRELFNKIRYDANFISLLAILNYFINNECSHKTYKREVFKCINIIEGLKEKYK
jgi:hypothetical protein